MSQFFESLRMRVETENESSHNKIESRDWEWDESFPWESQFRDRDESLAEVCLLDMIVLCLTKAISKKIHLLHSFGLETFLASPVK